MRRRADRGGCCGGKTTRCCLSRCTSRPSPHPPSPQQVIALLRSATTRFALFPCGWPGAQIECPFPAPPWLVVLTAMAVAFNHRLPAWSPARRPHDCWLARRSSHPIPLPTPSLHPIRRRSLPHNHAPSWTALPPYVALACCASATEPR